MNYQPSPEILPGERAKALQAIDLFLRMIDFAIVSFPNDDCETILVFLTVASASASPNLRSAALLDAMDAGPLLESQLHPVSGRSIAAACGLPRETVRRRLDALVAQGRIRRSSRGYTLVYSTLTRDKNLSFAKALIRTLEGASAKLARFEPDLD